MKKAIPIILLLLGLGAYVYFYHIRPDRIVDPSVRGSGTIEMTTVAIAAKTPSRILAVAASEGDHVQAGAVLVTLDCTDLAARKEAAAAQIVEAELAVSQTEATVAQARAQGQRARAELKPLEVTKDRAARDQQRMEQLAGIKGVPEKSVDDAASAVRTIDEQLAAAAVGITVVDKTALVAERTVAMARARVDTAHKNAALLDTQVTECTLKAPFGGVVTRRALEPGEMALPGAAVLRLAKQDTVYTWIYIPNEQVGRVHVGAAFALEADTYAGRRFEGRVVRINEQAEFTPKSVQTRTDRTRLVFGVKVEVQNPKGELLAGMPVEAVLLEAGGAGAHP